MVYRQKRGRLGSTRPEPVAQPVSIPASVGGINALDSYAAMPPQDCIYTYNLMPVEYGLQLRKGYRVYASGLPSEVRTIIPYESNSTVSTKNRLFAVTKEGIYNVTTDGETTPTQVVSFSTSSGGAGFGTWIEFTNDASDHYLFYADYENGVFIYEDATDTWSTPSGWTYNLGAGSTPFPVDNVAFIMVHKLRIWVILKDSDDAWYLPVASIAGELKKFTFGAKMKYGGNLQGLWTWSLDGGDGLDDYLVAAGRGGDLMVYRGSDPEATDFALNGNWFIGRIPDSRRIAIQYGAEMYMLSSFGITSMRDLIQGSAADNVRTSASAKINRILRASIGQSIGSNVWSMFINPSDGYMQVIAPFNDSQSAIQYNRNMNTGAWGMWEGVEATCAEPWDGNYYLGAGDSNAGEVWIYEGSLDGVLNDGTGGQKITFRVLTSFQAMGQIAFFKNVGMVRVIGRLSSDTNISLTAVYDYDIEAPLLDPAGGAATPPVLWDLVVWDEITWGYEVEPVNLIKGSYDIGRAVAIGMRGSSEARIEVVSWDVSLQQGGWL